MSSHRRSPLGFFRSLRVDGWRLSNEEETHRSPVLRTLSEIASSLDYPHRPYHDLVG